MRPHRDYISLGVSAILSSLCAVGCVSTYRINSTPDAGDVYHVQNGTKSFLGKTPFAFSKSALPQTTPFLLRFEKEGFENREVSILPSDEFTTSVDVKLKNMTNPAEDASLRRARLVLKQIFAVQELVYSKRYPDALSLLLQLEQSEPALAEVYVLRGSIYVLLNDPVNAKAQWEKALALDPALDALKVKISQLKLKEEKR